MSIDLRQLIAEKQAAFKANPARALATFESRSGLIEGFRTKAALRQHSVLVDEPAELGGTDAGPNPVELILAALGTCQEITYRAYATALGIPLDGVSVKLEGDIDLRGFFAVDDSVRPGYGAIRGTVTLESSADEATLQALRQAVNAHCPVLDIVAKPVPVDLDIAIVKPGHRAAAE
ncbi:MAG: OsmC family protein [Alphaproteobacteria bacterium]